MKGPGLGWEGNPGPSRPEVRVPGHLRRYRTPIGAPCTNFAVRQRLSRAVDRDFKGCADGAHLGVGKPAKPADQYCDRDTFDGVEVHRRTAGDRVGTGFKHNLAGKSPDSRGARCDECTSKPRDRRVTRQHNDWAPADLGHLTPPHLPACRKRTHEAPAARRHEARSPHSSGSSTGCSS